MLLPCTPIEVPSTIKKPRINGVALPCFFIHVAFHSFKIMLLQLYSGIDRHEQEVTTLKLLFNSRGSRFMQNNSIQTKGELATLHPTPTLQNIIHTWLMCGISN